MCIKLGEKCLSHNDKMRLLAKKRWEKRFYDKYGKEYKLLVPYYSSNKKVRVLHVPCGGIRDIYPKQIDTFRCANCYGYGRQKSNSNFLARVKKQWGNKYTVLGKYKRWNIPVEVRCNKCGNVFNTIPNNFLRGSGCPSCKKRILSIKHTTSFKDVSVTIKSLVGDDYFIDEDTFSGTNSKALFTHKKCGNRFWTKPNNFICNSSRCPFCSLREKQSKGECYIENFLQITGMTYFYPKVFNDLKDKLPLHYDFYIPKLNLLIEYQGKQHYSPVNLFGGDDYFATQQEHDLMKYKYAVENGYSVLYIPYMVNTQEKINNFLRPLIH